ncbi:sensor domain-containing diguanylate cyclase [Lacticaseibacillus porcinae]|uniref:bifunctional diguanylate cyclase/phosphodiesterase n=1 Tax=Lacticaseibacillus porcinae TaxID=1123687 RepID=UPI000F7734FB|nr:diguanylate cyclase [Lacticaseibacillus porcinae]
MHAWALWAIHVLLSAGIVAGYTMYYEYLWRQRGVLAQVGLPISNALLAAFCMLCGMVYPDSQRFYLNIAYFALVIALLDGHIDWRGYVVRGFSLLLFIGLLPVTPIANNIWPLIWVGLLLGLIGLWFIRKYVAYHLWATMGLGIYFWALFWEPQVTTADVITARVLITFLILVAEHHWLWGFEHRRRDQTIALKQQADHDRLTNALSYSRFRQDLAEVMAQGAFHLVMFDLDYFKSVNDEYGHPAGDQVLKQTAALVDQLCRPYHATLYRTGGEEFSIIVPATVDVNAFTQQLWQTQRQHQFQLKNQSLTLSASVGATVGQDHEHTVIDVIRRADSNLYLSKRRGRDTVTIDGKTLMAAGTRELISLFTYYTDPVVNLTTGETAANVLAVSRFDQNQGQWIDSVGAGFDIATMIQILQVNDPLLPQQAVLPVTAAQFTDSEAINQLCAYNATRPVDEQLVLSLNELPVFADFRKASQHFHQAGIHVVLVINNLQPYQNTRQVRQWIPYYDELEIDLDTLSPRFSEPGFIDKMQTWQQALSAAGKDLIVSGIANRNDVQTIRNLGIQFGRGRYFAEPTLPRM